MAMRLKQALGRLAGDDGEFTIRSSKPGPIAIQDIHGRAIKEVPSQGGVP